MLPIRTILHPTDFSERSEHAFQAAYSMARDHGSRLVVAYVKAPLAAAYDGTLVPMMPDPVQTPDDVRTRLADRHGLDPWVEVEYRVGEGEPSAEIIRMAGEVGANLIVMGTHGRTGLGRLLLGSVAEAVLRRAPCAVLTLKAPFLVGEVAPVPDEGVSAHA